MGWGDGRVSGTCVFGSFIKKPIKLQKILRVNIYSESKEIRTNYILKT